MANWFEENDPDKQQQDWFTANAPPEPDTLATRVQNFLFSPEGAKTVRESIQGAVQEIPKMPVQVAKSMYDVARAGFDRGTVGTVEELVKQGAPQGLQIAQDVESPFGSAEWLRGIGQLGMLAAPGIELARELRAPTLPSPKVVEPPPVQAGEVPPIASPEIPIQQPEIITPELGSPFQQPEIPAQDLPYAGQPQASTITLYHKSPNQFEVFDPERATPTGLGGRGVFFNSNINDTVYGDKSIAVTVPKSKILTHAEAENMPELKQGGNLDEIIQGMGYLGVEGPQPGDVILYKPNELLPAQSPIGAANKVATAREEAGLLGAEGAPEPGIGVGYKESVNEGNALIDQGVDPYKVVADFQKNNLINRQRMGVARAWLERLQRANNEAKGALEQKPNDAALAKKAQDAQDAENSFWKGYQPMKTEWSNIGTGMQEMRGITDSDLLSQSTAEQAMREHLDRELSEADKARAAKAVKDTREANGEVNRAFDKAIGEATRKAKGPVRDLQALADDLAKTLKEITC